MDLAGETEVLRAADAACDGAPLHLFHQLIAFVGHRWEAARAARNAMEEWGKGRACPCHLHAFLSECWDALDGVGRLVDIGLFPRFPDAGLCPAGQLTPQCTFYTVRRDLHRDPRARRHPLAQLMWEETRRSPSPAYKRLSFLYNLSRFVPVPLTAQCELPGWKDLPQHVRQLVRCQNVERCAPDVGMEGILRWEGRFIEGCYRLLAEHLRDSSEGGDGTMGQRKEP